MAEAFLLQQTDTRYILLQEAKQIKNIVPDRHLDEIYAQLETYFDDPNRIQRVLLKFLSHLSEDKVDEPEEPDMIRKARSKILRKRRIEQDPQPSTSGIIPKKLSKTANADVVEPKRQGSNLVKSNMFIDISSDDEIEIIESKVIRKGGKKKKGNLALSSSAHLNKYDRKTVINHVTSDVKCTTVNGDSLMHGGDVTNLQEKASTSSSGANNLTSQATNLAEPNSNNKFVDKVKVFKQSKESENVGMLEESQPANNKNTNDPLDLSLPGPSNLNFVDRDLAREFLETEENDTESLVVQLLEIDEKVKDEYYLHLMEMFPEADKDFVRNLCDNAPSNPLWLRKTVTDFLENDYPKGPVSDMAKDEELHKLQDQVEFPLNNVEEEVMNDEADAPQLNDVEDKIIDYAAEERQLDDVEGRMMFDELESMELSDVEEKLINDETHTFQSIEERAKMVDETYDNLVAILPNADPSFLRDTCEEIAGNDDEIKRFIGDALENGRYPTRADYEKRMKAVLEREKYLKNFKIEEFLEIFPDPFKYFTKEKKSKESDFYLYLNYLKARYRKIRVTHLQTCLWKHKCSLTKTCFELDKWQKFMKTVRYEHEIQYAMNEMKNIPFLQEVAFIENKEKIKAFLKDKERKRAEAFRKAKENNELLECGCCYDNEVLAEDSVTCAEGHIFCKSCLQKYAETQIGDGKFEFRCLTNCDGEFSLKTLQDVLKPSIFSKMLQRKQIEEVKSAGIPGLEYCPFCDFASIPPEEDKIFRCLNPECMKESCRKCKELSHIPLRCDEVEKSDEVKLRTYIEDRMTQALIRTCWRCEKKFIKIDGCNKMTCTCGAMMCYICRQPVKDYKHFNGEGGTEYHKCPLFSSNDELHVKAVTEEAQKAKTEALAKNPNMQLKHDPTNILPEKSDNAKGRHGHLAPALQGNRMGIQVNLVRRADHVEFVEHYHNEVLMPILERVQAGLIRQRERLHLNRVLLRRIDPPPAFARGDDAQRQMIRERQDEVRPANQGHEGQNAPAIQEVPGMILVQQNLAYEPDIPRQVQAQREHVVNRPHNEDLPLHGVVQNVPLQPQRPTFDHMLRTPLTAPQAAPHDHYRMPPSIHNPLQYSYNVEIGASHGTNHLRPMLARDYPQEQNTYPMALGADFLGHHAVPAATNFLHTAPAPRGPAPAPRGAAPAAVGAAPAAVGAAPAALGAAPAALGAAPAALGVAPAAVGVAPVVKDFEIVTHVHGAQAEWLNDATAAALTRIGIDDKIVTGYKTENDDSQDAEDGEDAYKAEDGEDAYEAEEGDDASEAEDGEAASEAENGEAAYGARGVAILPHNGNSVVAHDGVRAGPYGTASFLAQTAGYAWKAPGARERTAAWEAAGAREATAAWPTGLMPPHAAGGATSNAARPIAADAKATGSGFTLYPFQNSIPAPQFRNPISPSPIAFKSETQQGLIPPRAVDGGTSIVARPIAADAKATENGFTLYPFQNSIPAPQVPNPISPSPITFKPETQGTSHVVQPPPSIPKVTCFKPPDNATTSWKAKSEKHTQPVATQDSATAAGNTFSVAQPGRHTSYQVPPAEHVFHPSKYCVKSKVDNTGNNFVRGREIGKENPYDSLPQATTYTDNSESQRDTNYTNNSTQTTEYNMTPQIIQHTTVKRWFDTNDGGNHSK